MPDLKISQLPVASTPLAGTELVPIVQGGVTDQTTVANFLSAGLPVSASTLNTTGNVTLGNATTDTVTVNGYMGVGSAPAASQGLRVVPTALTGTTQFGAILSLTATSAATAGVEAARVQAGTAATSFTAGYAAGLWVRDAILGAGSTITSNYGIYVDDKTVGTNNFGITSAVTAGTDKWNIYASGTAQNYFGGRVGLGTPVPAGVLDVNGTVYSRFLNTTAPTLDNDTHAGEVLYLRSGGTAGAENVQAVLAFGKADSSSQRSGAAIASIQTTSDADQIGLAFYVSPTTSSFQTMSERFRIGTTEAVFNEVSADYDFRVESDTNTHALFVQGSDGNVGIGTSIPLTTLHAQGAGVTLGGLGSVVSAIYDTSVSAGVRAVLGFGTTNGAATPIHGAVGAVRESATASDPQGGLAFYSRPSGGNLTERLRIDSSGNVGIGTSSPTQAKFVLSNNTASLDSAFINAAINSTGRGLVISANTRTASDDAIACFESISRLNGTALATTVAGNVGIGGKVNPASGVSTLCIFNGTAPTGSVADGIVLYAEDVTSSSELKVRDEAGNVTTLSPHNFSLIPDGPSEDMAWAYYSEKGGKRINVDMLKLARMVEKLTGEKLVYEN